MTQAKQFIDPFSLNWQLVPENTLACDDCEFVGRSGSVDVYRNNYDQFIAIYSLLPSKAWLVIDEAEVIIFEETAIVDYPEQIEGDVFLEFSLDDIAPVSLLFIVLITIASAIYWPIRTLQSQIEKGYYEQARKVTKRIIASDSKRSVIKVYKRRGTKDFWQQKVDEEY